jgi:hypothetical protein
VIGFSFFSLSLFFPLRRRKETRAHKKSHASRLVSPRRARLGGSDDGRSGEKSEDARREEMGRERLERKRCEIVVDDAEGEKKTPSRPLPLDLFFRLCTDLSLSPPTRHSPSNNKNKNKNTNNTQAETTTTCDDACQRHVKLVEGAILALTVGAALAAGAGFLHAIDTPTRFLGGSLDKSGAGGGGGGDGGVN